MSDVKIGDVFGELTVIEVIKSLRQKMSPLKCLCSCGNERIVPRGVLLSGERKSCGCRKTAKIAGQKFNKLTAIEICGKRGRRNLWRCLCDCGNYTTASVDDLRSSDKKSCGCLNANHNDSCWTGYGEISGSKWDSIKRGASIRNLDFQITMQEAWLIFENQNRKCFLTNDELSFGKTRATISDTTASLDRIDSSGVYEKNNLCWIHKDLNWIKNDMSVEELLYWTSIIKNPIINESTPEFTVYKSNKKWSGYGNVSGSYLTTVRNNASKRDIEFNITAIDIWNQFLLQNGRCAITNLDLKFIPSRYKDKTGIQTASIDRIDSNLGYFPENIQILHKTVNQMKWNFDQSYFIELCTKVINNYDNIKKNLKERYNISL
jgi:hypothetical protein